MIQDRASEEASRRLRFTGAILNHSFGKEKAWRA